MVAAVLGVGMTEWFAADAAVRVCAAPVADRAAALAAADPATRVLIPFSKCPVDAALLDAFPGLRLIAAFGAGYDQIDAAAACARGVIVSHTPGLTSACVADMAIGLLLAVSRGICLGDRHVRAGKWPQGRIPLTRRVTGQRLGIFGMGMIGAEIARRAQAFDMEIGYHNRARRPDLHFAYHETLEGLAEWADILVVACPLTPQTRRRVDAGILKRLGASGVLVNIARGAVVDQAALMQALQDGTIAGAGLDVIDGEPAVPPALLALDNAVVTPHCAGGTWETWRACADLLLRNVEAFLATGRALTPVPECAGLAAHPTG